MSSLHTTVRATVLETSVLAMGDSGGNSAGKGQTFEDCHKLRGSSKKEPSKDNPNMIDKSQDTVLK